jgi:hypothetical protein
MNLLDLLGDDEDELERQKGTDKARQDDDDKRELEEQKQRDKDDNFYTLFTDD